jgi:hypothetical protein
MTSYCHSSIQRKCDVSYWSAKNVLSDRKVKKQIEINGSQSKAFTRWGDLDSIRKKGDK